MEDLPQYLVPYLISNFVFGLTILGAWKWPMVTRIFLALIFLVASGVNAVTVLNSPEAYLQYGRMAFLPAYRQFINGFFSEHIELIVLPIAAGQFLIMIGLMLGRPWVQIACMCGILFGLNIACLGVGSAFPSSVLMSIAFFILLVKYEHDYVWNWGQYRSQRLGKSAGMLNS